MRGKLLSHCLETFVNQIETLQDVSRTCALRHGRAPTMTDSREIQQSTCRLLDLAKTDLASTRQRPAVPNKPHRRQLRAS